MAQAFFGFRDVYGPPVSGKTRAILNLALILQAHPIDIDAPHGRRLRSRPGEPRIRVESDAMQSTRPLNG